jgi:hypothetical protein
MLIYTIIQDINRIQLTVLNCIVNYINKNNITSLEYSCICKYLLNLAWANILLTMIRRLKAVDLYRKVLPDYQKSTLLGAALSVATVGVTTLHRL